MRRRNQHRSVVLGQGQIGTFQQLHDRRLRRQVPAHAMSLDSLELLRVIDEFDSRLLREQFQGSDEIVRREIDRLRGRVGRIGYGRCRQECAKNESRQCTSLRRSRENG